MTVYVEYAFIENLLLDGLLLYLALKCAKTKIVPWRLILSSLIGGAGAIVFPLFSLPAALSLLVKIFFGLLLVLIAVRERNIKAHLVTAVSFFGMTFAFGGLLLGVYACFGISYLPGEGYVIESVPVTFVLCSAAIFTIVCVRLFKGFYRYRRRRQNLLDCKLCSGGKELTLRGYADSGNRLYFRGSPVCVISAIGALALFRAEEPVGRMTISTVSGSRESPVFSCERMTIEGVEKQNILFTVGEVPSKEHSLIIHTALVEDRHEDIKFFKRMAEETRGE